MRTQWLDSGAVGRTEVKRRFGLMFILPFAYAEERKRRHKPAGDALCQEGVAAVAVDGAR